MKKIISLALIPFLALPLIGCDQNQVDIAVAHYRVVDVPAALYDACPAIGAIPNYKTLTDRQVADFIVKLYNNNKQCRQAIKAIKNYLDSAHKAIDN